MSMDDPRPRDFPHRDAFLKESKADPLEAARKELGSVEHENYSAVGHENLVRTSKNRRAFLAELGDIYRGIDWHEALEVISSSRFKTVHSHTYYDFARDDVVDEFTVHAHDSLPVLLTANSHGGEGLSHVEFHGVMDSTNLTKIQREALSYLSVSRSPMSEISIGEWESGDQLFHQIHGTWFEGLKVRLDLIEENQLPFVDWPVIEDEAKIALLDRNEQHYLSFDERAAVQLERIEALPKRVQEFMQIGKRPEGYSFLQQPFTP